MNESLWKLESTLCDLENINNILAILREDYLDNMTNEADIVKDFYFIAFIVKSIETAISNQNKSLKEFINCEYAK